MKISVLTLFPQFFDSFLKMTNNKRAIGENILEFETINIRNFSKDKNKRVDDKPIGGGSGLILKIEPLVDSLKSVKQKNSKTILLTPRGKTLNQAKVRQLAKEEHLILICGHYEGVDERINDYIDEEISIGDYILSGGETAALVLSEAIVRLLEGAINEQSILEESFENGLLEYPQYTFPKIYDEKKVPLILSSGNHQAIAKWRKKESLRKTLANRPDLLEDYELSKEEKQLIDELQHNQMSTWEKDAIKNSSIINKEVEK